MAISLRRSHSLARIPRPYFSMVRSGLSRQGSCCGTAFGADQSRNQSCFGSRLPLSEASSFRLLPAADRSPRSCEGNRPLCRAARRRTFRSPSYYTNRIRRQAEATLRSSRGAAKDFAWRITFSLALDHRTLSGFRLIGNHDFRSAIAGEAGKVREYGRDQVAVMGVGGSEAGDV